MFGPVFVVRLVLYVGFVRTRPVPVFSSVTSSPAHEKSPIHAALEILNNALYYDSVTARTRPCRVEKTVEPITDPGCFDGLENDHDDEYDDDVRDSAETAVSTTTTASCSPITRDEPTTRFCTKSAKTERTKPGSTSVGRQKPTTPSCRTRRTRPPCDEVFCKPSPTTPSGLMRPKTRRTPCCGAATVVLKSRSPTAAVSHTTETYDELRQSLCSTGACPDDDYLAPPQNGADACPPSMSGRVVVEWSLPERRRFGSSTQRPWETRNGRYAVNRADENPVETASHRIRPSAKIDDVLASEVLYDRPTDYVH